MNFITETNPAERPHEPLRGRAGCSYTSPVHIELKSAKLPEMFRQFCGYASDSIVHVYERCHKNIPVFASSFFAAILRQFYRVEP